MAHSKYQGKFVDATRKPINGWQGISPIFTINSNHKTILLGTGFFITRNGLMLTAKHCLLDGINKWYDNLFIVQFLENKSFAIRPIFKTYWNSSDIAVLLPKKIKLKKTWIEPLNPVPIITTRRPQIGEVISSFGYPTTIIQEKGDVNIIDVDETWHFGEIEEFLPNGTPLLKNSCYQTSMHILGGSSGGPVSNSEGKVFAINSTGSDVIEGLTPYSFLTPIEHCLNIVIDGITGQKYSIRQLIELNQILCES
jgi:S1-C subfamily serine protease